MSDDLVKLAREWDENGPPQAPFYSTGGLIAAMADCLEEREAKLAKAVRLMELSVELATWNTTLLEDVIDFITEIKGQYDEV